jgi:4a-hydroxytetrahydrobiopterin dehydratase
LFMKGAKTMKLEEQHIARQMETIPHWTREDKMIVRRYRFSSFPEAIQFVNRVADIAERRNHHPFISIDYKVVTLKLTSWHAGGLTLEDFEEAKELDALYGE